MHATLGACKAWENFQIETCSGKLHRKARELKELVMANLKSIQGRQKVRLLLEKLSEVSNLPKETVVLSLKDIPGFGGLNRLD